jgi:hypothetical protein
VGGKGNEGVAAQVREFPGAIGYVELIYALQNHIDFGFIKNASGSWVKASIQGVTAAAATAKIPADYRVSITNAPGAESYPISSFTYLLIPTHPSDMAKEKVIKDLLSWSSTRAKARSRLSLTRRSLTASSRRFSNRLRTAVTLSEGSGARRAPRPSVVTRVPTPRFVCLSATRPSPFLPGIFKLTAESQEQQPDP